ncbi:MAG TPA: DEAD/DEAH box helicase, partial [Bacillota bacterium]|nr:DEAD/DEAH box helicase [Bacillota bacterium]
YSISPQAYKEGMTYYQQGRIKDLRIQRNKLVIYSKVRGNRDYNIKIIFDDDGVFKSASCSCPPSREYWGHCKHTVAVLTHLKWLVENDGFKQVIQKRKARELFDYFDPKTITEKKRIGLKPVFEFRPSLTYKYGTASLLSFKIGLDRLYVIRDIKNFFDRLNSDEVIEFGKAFTFDPDRHQIKGDRLFDFVNEMYEASEQAKMGSRNGTFKGKYLCLTDAMIKRFFGIMGEDHFTALFEDETIKQTRVVDDQIPARFTVDKADESLVFSMELGEHASLITQDSRYVLLGNCIHRLSDDRISYLNPFFNVLKQTGESSFIFTGIERDKFISEVLPYAGKAGSVEISDDIEGLILREQLSSKVYFDREGPEIRAQIRFNYGPIEIDPFAVRDAQDSDSKILLRDIHSERRILGLFDQYSFMVRPNGVFLGDEDLIFEFFYSGLPSLIDLADIFYSDDFKQVVRERAEYTAGVSISSQTGLLEFDFQMGDIDPSELSHIFSALKEKKRYYRLRDGSFVSLEDKRLFGIADLLNRLGIRGKDLKQGSIELPKYRALYLDQLDNRGEIDLEKDEAFKTLIEDIQGKTEVDIRVPESLKGVLRDYQQLGFEWLMTLSHYGFGGILADDMGLGKTLQVLAMILSDKERGIREPSLVIAPTSLIYNWEAEVKKFVPQLKTLIITGKKSERLDLLKTIPDADIVITSYPLVIRDKEDYEHYSFNYCIIDEAQHIKNPATRGAKAVKSIRAKRRFALSGTPIENSLTELWSIFDFIMPGYLYSHLKFTQEYERPIVKDQDQEALSALSMQTKPFLLRRLKTDVLKELPEKIENVMLSELTEGQKKVYYAYLTRLRTELNQEVEEAGFDKSRIKVLSALTRLRQICCHPSVFLENFTGGSGKLLLLDEIIENALRGDHRILLFSQFTSMLKLIRDRLDEKQIETLYLDGSTQVAERGRLVNEFNEGVGDVFLISLKAGGTGLNLTGADTVIHYDPWWNPAVEDQASDRAHRIGQKNTVHVMRLIAKGTIEEKIEELKGKKRDLAEAVIRPGESFVSAMSEQELMALFD